jgi:ATP-binding cassette, subfamily C (CFTR/MRP), member 1
MGRFVPSLIIVQLLISYLVYQSYFQAARGFITIPMLVLATILMQGCQVANSYTLVLWQAK